MGEGRGKGEYDIISIAYIPLFFILSRQRRGSTTFYKIINCSITKNLENFYRR
jgi:hypothetical protein